MNGASATAIWIDNGRFSTMTPRLEAHMAISGLYVWEMPRMEIPTITEPDDPEEPRPHYGPARRSLVHPVKHSGQFAKRSKFTISTPARRSRSCC